MTPKLKVYGITAHISAPLTPEMLGSAPHVRQAHAVVAAPSKKAAAEALGINMYEFNHSGGETGNDESIAVALAEPGTVFYQSMNSRRGNWYRGDGTPFIPTEIKPKGTHFTAGELAAILSQLPADAPLFVTGYESSVNYVTEVVPCHVALFANVKDYYGQHADNQSDAGNRALDTFGYELKGEHIRGNR